MGGGWKQGLGKAAGMGGPSLGPKRRAGPLLLGVAVQGEPVLLPEWGSPGSGHLPSASGDRAVFCLRPWGPSLAILPADHLLSYILPLNRRILSHNLKAKKE